MNTNIINVDLLPKAVRISDHLIQVRALPPKQIADLTDLWTIEFVDGTLRKTLSIALPRLQEDGSFMHQNNWYVGVPVILRPVVEIRADEGKGRQAIFHPVSHVDPRIELFINKKGTLSMVMENVDGTNREFTTYQSNAADPLYIMADWLIKRPFRMRDVDRTDLNTLVGTRGEAKGLTRADLTIVADIVMNHPEIVTNWKDLNFLRAVTLPDMMANILGSGLLRILKPIVTNGIVDEAHAVRLLNGWLANSPQCQLDDGKTAIARMSLRDKVKLPIEGWDELSEAIPDESWAHAFCSVDTPQSSDAGALVALVEGAKIENGRVIPDPEGRIYSRLLHRALVFPQNISPNRQVMVSAISKQTCDLGTDGEFNETPLCQSDADESIPELAGRNLVVAFMDDRLWCHEDGCEISESAAAKFATDVIVTDVITSFGPLGTDEMLDDGMLLVHVGDTLKKGTPMAHLNLPPEAVKVELNDEATETIESNGVRQVRMFRYSSNLHGEVVSIETRTEVRDNIKVFRTEVKTKCRHFCSVGSKLAGRHSNKHIVNRVVPDSEMPRLTLPNGQEVMVDMICSPNTVGGRMNPSLVLEAMTGLWLRYSENDWSIQFPQFDTDHTLEVQADCLRTYDFPADAMFQLRVGKHEFEHKTLVGVVFVSRLHHHAPDKMRMGNEIMEDFREVPRYGAGTQGIAREELECLREHGANGVIAEVLGVSRCSGARERLNSLLSIVGYELITD